MTDGRDGAMAHEQELPVIRHEVRFKNPFGAGVLAAFGACVGVAGFVGFVRVLQAISSALGWG